VTIPIAQKTTFVDGQPVRSYELAEIDEKMFAEIMISLLPKDLNIRRKEPPT